MGRMEVARVRGATTAAEKRLASVYLSYMSRDATLRELYAAADEVLEERREEVSHAARSKVINEVSAKRGREKHV